jgi:hypothetical protein
MKRICKRFLRLPYFAQLGRPDWAIGRSRYRPDSSFAIVAAFSAMSWAAV